MAAQEGNNFSVRGGERSVGGFNPGSKPGFNPGFGGEVEVAVDSRRVAKDAAMAVTVDMDMATVDSLEVTKASGEVVAGKTTEEVGAMLAGTISQCRLALITTWLHPITRRGVFLRTCSKRVDRPLPQPTDRANRIK
jgi:hypothetical protein